MSFDVSRLRKSDQIIAGSAILFFIFLFFFKWYGVSASASGLNGVGGIDVSASRSGWDVFTNSRWIWLITIIVALVAVAVASGTLKFQSPVQLSVLVAGLGALSTILIAYRIVHHPSANVAGFHAGIKLGIWLGLIAAGGVAYGGYLAMRDEGTSIADVREQASAAVAGMSSPSEAPAPSSATTAAPDPAAGSESDVPPTPPPADPER